MKVDRGQNVRATKGIIPMPRKSTTCFRLVTHWLALGDWLQVLTIGNLWELIGAIFDKQPGRNHVLFVFFLFSEVGTYIEDAQRASSLSYFQLPTL